MNYNVMQGSIKSRLNKGQVGIQAEACNKVASDMECVLWFIPWSQISLYIAEKVMIIEVQIFKFDTHCHRCTAHTERSLCSACCILQYDHLKPVPGAEALRGRLPGEEVASPISEHP